MFKTWSLLVTLFATGLMAVASPDLQISAPRNGSIVEGPDVVISGYANAGSVTVRVTGGNARVYSNSLAVKNGRWQTPSVRMGNGTYIATVVQGSSTKSVSFTVGASRGFGITSPENGQTLSNPNVTIRGTADAGTITLRVYRGTSLAFSQNVSASNGSWSVTRRLEAGTYRAEAERSGTKRTISFKVGAGGTGFGFTSPDNGDTVSGPNVTISGTADSGTVVLRVYKGSSLVFTLNVGANNGRWSVTRQLTTGTYRAEATRSGATRTISFKVGSWSSGFGFTSPDNGDTVTGPDVTISGTADSGTVALRVYNGSELVINQNVNASNGSWSVTRRMNSGTYRAEATRNGTTRSISFRVGFGDTGNPGAESGLPIDIESPRDGSIVSGPDVTFSGRATVDAISIRLYDGDEVVYSGAVEVHEGRWSMTRRMSQGPHAVVVQQRDMIRSAKFSVGFGGIGNTGTIRPADSVLVASPRNGANVRGPRVTFSGTATSSSVGVNIYQGNRRVYDSSQKVTRGRWSFSTSLKKGSYQVEVTAGGSRSTITVKVR